MKQKTKIALARKLTRFVKPCRFYETVQDPKREYVVCQWDKSRRKYCKTRSCPHFIPTTRYRIARWFGMVR